MDLKSGNESTSLSVTGSSPFPFFPLFPPLTPPFPHLPPLSPSLLLGHMHRAGINVRYLGLVLKYLWKKQREEKREEGEGGGGGWVEMLFLIEGVGRVVKNELNLLMREKTKQLKLPREVIL